MFPQPAGGARGVVSVCVCVRERWGRWLETGMLGTLLLSVFQYICLLSESVAYYHNTFGMKQIHAISF